MVGGSISIPIDIKRLETTRSNIKNGRYIRKLISKAVVSSLTINAGPFASPSPAVKTYGRFADVMREKVGGRSEFPENTAADALDKSGKVKNINEAKFKNKADNIFFDIEERLKGLMESDVKSKKL